jgi:hypothetical protein
MERRIRGRRTEPVDSGETSDEKDEGDQECQIGQAMQQTTRSRGRVRDEADELVYLFQATGASTYRA